MQIAVRGLVSCTIAFVAGLMLATCGVISQDDLADMGIGKKKQRSVRVQGAAGGGGATSSDIVTVHLGLSDGGSFLSLDHTNFADPVRLFAPKKNDAFNLVSVLEQVTFGITGCASGFTATGLTDTNNDVAVDLYMHDRNCKAVLESFTFKGHFENTNLLYTPLAPATPLAGANNSSLLYQESTNSTKVMVSVIKQLESVVGATDYAKFAFKRILVGNVNVTPWNDYNESNTLSVLGVEAPNASIGANAITLTDIQESGAGVFTVVFTCGTPLAGSPPYCLTKGTGGDQQLLSNMTALLTLDDLNPTATPTATPDYATLDVLPAWNTPTFARTVGALGESTFQAAGLTVPNAPKLYNNRQMVLYLRYNDAQYGNSYRYFHIDIGEPRDSPTATPTPP